MCVCMPVQPCQGICVCAPVWLCQRIRVCVHAFLPTAALRPCVTARDLRLPCSSLGCWTQRPGVLCPPLLTTSFLPPRTHTPHPGGLTIHFRKQGGQQGERLHPTGLCLGCLGAHLPLSATPMPSSPKHGHSPLSQAHTSTRGFRTHLTTCTHSLAPRGPAESRRAEFINRPALWRSVWGQASVPAQPRLQQRPHHPAHSGDPVSPRTQASVLPAPHTGNSEPALALCGTFWFMKYPLRRQLLGAIPNTRWDPGRAGSSFPTKEPRGEVERRAGNRGDRDCSSVARAAHDCWPEPVRDTGEQPPPTPPRTSGSEPRTVTEQLTETDASVHFIPAGKGQSRDPRASGLGAGGGRGRGAGPASPGCV